MSSAILDVNNLHFRYRDTLDEVLRGVNLTQYAGEYVALVGAAGVGKSTFCRCLNRVIPSFNKGDLKGGIQLAGESIAGKEVRQMAPRIGMVFQEFEAQLFSTNVELEVAFGLENLCLPVDEMSRRVQDSLALVGMTGYKKREPAKLSGGEKQRLAIAAVVAMAPDLLVMDEPATDLDPIGKEAVLHLAETLARAGKAVLFVDHDVDGIANADRIEVLAGGVIALSGSSREVLAQPEELRRFGVRPPQIPEFFHRVGLPEIPITVEEGLSRWKDTGRKLDHARIAAAESDKSQRSGEPLIEVRDLVHAYAGGVTALQGVTVSIYPGEIVAVLGHNGCGKTTLARHLNGLLAPTSGSVKLKSRSVGEQSLSEIGRQIGYVFQNPDHQLFADTVRREVEFGPRNLGMLAEERARRIAETLAAVGMQGREDDNPFILSKGERQRVAVASVLAAGPEIIILDEPTTGLDFRQQLSMMNLVRQLHAAGRTVILITHSMWIAAEYADRCLVMADGTVIADGTPREVFSNEEALDRAGLKPPAITRLGNALGVAALSVDELLAFLEGGEQCPPA